MPPAGPSSRKPPKHAANSDTGSWDLFLSSSLIGQLFVQFRAPPRLFPLVRESCFFRAGSRQCRFKFALLRFKPLNFILQRRNGSRGRGWPSPLLEQVNLGSQVGNLPRLVDTDPNRGRQGRRE